jgi:ring-1,2-phenylacetyl-CoA epoxidase subunit PaaD
MGAPASLATAPPPELLARLHGILAQVADPEIPVLSVLDLGVIRHLALRPGGEVEVGIAPTYSGCPANAVIKADVLRALGAAGFEAVAVDVLAPPWSSDWLSEAGRRKLEAFGIAPPAGRARSARQADAPAACPRCGSQRTQKVSEFGSTPCKAHYRCQACLEPFDYFKCL